MDLANAMEFLKFFFELVSGMKNVIELYEKITANLKRRK
jgi:hypothetical protein